MVKYSQYCHCRYVTSPPKEPTLVFMFTPRERCKKFVSPKINFIDLHITVDFEKGDLALKLCLQIWSAGEHGNKDKNLLDASYNGYISTARDARGRDNDINFSNILL